jgi:aryl-alcohol dehydrogenase-like predicted oxidoreductase
MIETAAFGRTGHQSTRVIFGAAGLGRVGQEEADAVLELLLEQGINHLDTAAGYGEAELRMAPWMPEHRHRFFVATKTSEREGGAARASLERSLTRLQIDKLDSIQLHNLVEEDEWQTAFAPGGAVEALQAAREEGLVDHIGVTGHGLRIPAMHRRSLERFDFDSVLFPYNAPLLADPQYRADVEALIEICGFVLSRPELFLLTSSDWRNLSAILSAAQRPLHPSADEVLADRDAYGTQAIFTPELERI